MRIVFAIIIVLLLPLSGLSRELTPATVDQTNRLIEEVNEAVSSVTTIQCDFSQEKTLSLMRESIVSNGVMMYNGSGKLRWEYISPYTYTFILNGDNVAIKSGAKTSVIDVKSSKLFQEITRIMMNSITGKCLSDTKEFKVDVYVGDDVWVADLYPQKKEMKRMFKKIRLHFNKSNPMVNKIEMCEKNGDMTTIVLANVKINEPLNEAYFTAD